MKSKFNLGIIPALPAGSHADPLHDLKKYSKSDSVEVLLFPEGYLHSENLTSAQEVAKDNKKWLVTGVDDFRESKNKFETALIINPKGEIVGEHKKTSLTEYEIKHGYSRGDSIEVIDTDFGKVGITICYEIHFPEISRVYALQGARIIFNTIGTGMWNEKQYRLWNSVAQTRASENKAYVFGCSHFNDAIPVAFAYAPDGECLVQARDCNRLIKVGVDLDKFPIEGFNNFKQRRPELYEVIGEG